MEVRTAYIRSASQTSPKALDAHHRDNFSEVFASLNASGSDTYVSAPSSKINHRVRPGETLFGIAQKQLINSGQKPSPGASMAHALKIAKDNHIHNPDCIYAGQMLVLEKINSVTQTNQNSPQLVAINASRLTDRDARQTINIADVETYDYLDWQNASPRIDEVNYELPVSSILSPKQLIEERPIPIVSTISHNREIELYEQNATTNPIHSNTSVITSDILYKGVVGKILDAVPMESTARIKLQQANAVISSTLTGRALGALTGIGGVIIGFAGFLWGILSANKIQSASNDDKKQGIQTASTTPIN